MAASARPAMTDLPYVLAAYSVVIVALGGYALHLRRRLERARRRRTMIDRTTRAVDAVGSDVPARDRA